MNLRKARKIIVVTVASGLVLGACAFGALRWEIQSALDESCRLAQAAHPHPGDDIAALLAFARSPSHSLRQRNHAVWALGQARDPRALPFLESCYTGAPCDHERGLCQHELAKAIACCRGPAPNVLLLDTP